MTLKRLLRFVRLTGPAVLAGLALTGCASKSEPPKTDLSPNAGLVVPVQVAVASRTDLAVTRVYSGSLEGEEQANIVSKLAERVTGLKAVVGAEAAAGQVLITLDKSGATSQYFQAEANYRNAEKSLQRMKSLYDEGAIALQTLDGAQTAFDVARANFDAARSSVELSTPIAGVVTAVNVSIGDLASPGGVLATVARINRMKVIFNMSEADIARLAPGQTVAVYSEARPDQSIEGKIVQLSKSADPGSRTFEVKAIFPNTRDGWYKPGMFCKVRVPISARNRTLGIPTAAIQSDGTTSRVFVVRNGRAYQRSVEPGIANDQDTEILNGLSPNDTVATVGLNNLRDSVSVTVVRQ
ncbi:MAG TPA: efflux RND transporter periplasmic adaptor subunit [Chloroflexota bacterium]